MDDDAELTAAERLLLVRLYVASAGQAGCRRTPYGRLWLDPAPQTTPGPRHAKPDHAHDL